MDFFQSCIYDRRLVKRPILTYNDDRQLHCIYSYAEFGMMVQRAATSLHDQIGLPARGPAGDASGRIVAAWTVHEHGYDGMAGLR